MKKVLVGYISRGKTSGIDRYLLNLIAKVDHSEYNLDFLTRINAKDVREIMSKNNFGLYQIPRNRHIFKQFFALKKIIQNNQYDIAYFNISETSNCMGLIVAKLFGIKHIIVHSHNSGSDGNFFAKNAKRLLNLIFKPVVYLAADEFYTCSDTAARWLFTKRIVETKQYKFIPNAIDFKKFTYTKSESTSARQSICEKYHIPSDALIIGHIGRFTHAKNNCFLIDILKETLKTRDAYLLCIGERTEDFAKFQSYAIKLGIRDHVITPGVQTSTAEYYQAFDIFVLPSRFEGLPVVAIEAQASNLPCIISDRIDPEVKISTQAEFLPIKDPKKWSEKVLAMAKEKTHSNTLLRKANKFNSNEPSEDIFYTKNPHQPKSFNLAVYFFFALHYLLNLTNVLNGLHLFLFPGAICLLLFFLNYLLNKRKTLKSAFKDPAIRFLALFYLSYIITALFTTNYNLIGTVKIAIWTLFYSAFAFGYKLNQSKSAINFEVKHFFFYIISFLTLINIINLAFLILGISGKISTPFADKILVGYASWGRFYGIFYDPNYASIVCSCAIIFSIHLIQQTQKRSTKILLAIANAIQLTYMIAGQSRTGFITLSVGLFVYVILFVINHKNQLINRKRIPSDITLTVLTLLLTFCFIQAPNVVRNFKEAQRESKISQITANTVENITKQEQNELEELTKEKQQSMAIDLGRTDSKNDISNRRFDIWKSGLEIYSISNRIIGIGHSNTIDYAKEKIPETYIVNNDFQEFDAFHNSLIDLLVSQGILGFIIILLFTIFLFFLTIKNSKTFKDAPITIPILASLLAIMISSMFVSEIFYINNCCTFIFWVLLGYYYYFLQTNNRERIKHEN